MKWLLSLTLCTFALTAQGVAALDLPGAAQLTGERREAAGAQPFPIGAFQGAETPMLMAEGEISHRAYALPGSALTPFQMIDPLKSQLETQGFETLFACADTVCGGFDFRYRLDLLPAPALHVDLSNFQYLLARHEDGRVTMVLTSRATQTGYMQITAITLADLPEVTLTAPAVALPEEQTARAFAGTDDPRIAALTRDGHVVLDDLEFDSGSAALGPGRFASLAALADFLAQNPDATIALVGHTDAVGSLEGNTNLSRKRAASVRDRLISEFGAKNSQVSATGIGYLAPRASNTTEEGRALNRRVEAILTSTQ